jgi:L-asparaginase II
VTESFVEVTRGDVVESRHRIHAAVVVAGTLRFVTGSPDIVTVTRSAVKSIQAQPLIDDGVLGELGWGARELALACASHSGEPEHVRLAAAMLASVGLDESDLACGPHAPYHEPSARALAEAGQDPGRLHNNCSGKHAGMLALARKHGWPTAGYHEGSHPVQQRMLAEMSKWTGLAADEIAVGIDGCGVVTYGVPLHSLAYAFSKLSLAAASGEPGPSAVVDAMTLHPHLVGGTGRLCTELMREMKGDVFVKVGAEGVYCAGIPLSGIGVALKVEDGSTRGSETALLAVLREIWVLRGDEPLIERFRQPQVLNTRDEVVGEVRSNLRLESV